MLTTILHIRRMRQRKRQLVAAAGLAKSAAGPVERKPEPAAEPKAGFSAGAGRLAGAIMTGVGLAWSLVLDAIWLLAVLVVVVVAANASGWEHPVADFAAKALNKIMIIAGVANR